MTIAWQIGFLHQRFIFVGIALTLLVAQAVNRVQLFLKINDQGIVVYLFHKPVDFRQRAVKGFILQEVTPPSLVLGIGQGFVKIAFYIRQQRQIQLDVLFRFHAELEEVLI